MFPYGVEFILITLRAVCCSHNSVADYVVDLPSYVVPTPRYPLRRRYYDLCCCSICISCLLYTIRCYIYTRYSVIVTFPVRYTFRGDRCGRLFTFVVTFVEFYLHIPIAIFDYDVDSRLMIPIDSTLLRLRLEFYVTLRCCPTAVFYAHTDLTFDLLRLHSTGCRDRCPTTA